LPPLRFLTGWLVGYFNLRNQITRRRWRKTFLFFPNFTWKSLTERSPRRVIQWLRPRGN
jgi:hypothetical protein